jgi:uncharacterized SAM-binding protein YcdF (DUF218 family)
MGWDGLSTFLLSIAVVTISGGLTFLLCWIIVLKFSRLPTANGAAPDVILVMGLRLNHGEITREFEARLDEAARHGTICPVIVLGGMASGKAPTEAAAGQRWLVARGFDENSILLEETSRNSLENLAHARALMHSKNFRRPLLITSRYHLARSSILASSLGISHNLSAPDHPTMRHPAALTRSLFEALMINWYYVAWATARATGNSAMLSRIS